MKTQIIAELGINHNGDIGIAKKLIDTAAAAGCDFVKLQKRDIGLVYTKEELDTPRESPWGTTTLEQKEGIEFKHYECETLYKYAREKDIGLFWSAWDTRSMVELCDAFDMPFLKIPSALITNTDILETARDTGKPLILSTGMCDMEMVDRAVSILGPSAIYCIMQCTSTYPTATNEVNLKAIPRLKSRYPWTKIGFSNHHPGVIFMPVAVAMGAEMIEFHITLDRAMYGSDQAASIEPEGVFKLVKYIRGVEQALGDGVKQIYESERPIIRKLRR